MGVIGFDPAYDGDLVLSIHWFCQKLITILEYLGWFTKKPGDWQPPITGCISGEKQHEITSARAWTLEAHQQWPLILSRRSQQSCAGFVILLGPTWGCTLDPTSWITSPLHRVASSCIELHPIFAGYIMIIHDLYISINLHKSPLMSIKHHFYWCFGGKPQRRGIPTRSRGVFLLAPGALVKFL